MSRREKQIRTRVISDDNKQANIYFIIIFQEHLEEHVSQTGILFVSLFV